MAQTEHGQVISIHSKSSDDVGMVPYTCHPSIWEFRGLQVQRLAWAT